ncbi:hypothetical protein FRC18_008256 [Serendipita sp. 400]|nr:hypothetical protein FRC18_008256 [Serendipita sp. 400]
MLSLVRLPVVVYLNSPTPPIAFQAKNSSGYQVAATSLNMDQQVFLTEVMRQAEQKEAEVAAAGQM